jgi:hypothetical protein
VQICFANDLCGRTGPDKGFCLILLHEDFCNAIVPAGWQDHGERGRRLDYRLLLRESFHLRPRNRLGRAVLWKQMHQYSSHVVYGVRFGYFVGSHHPFNAYSPCHEIATSYKSKGCRYGNLSPRCYVRSFVYSISLQFSSWIMLIDTGSALQVLPALWFLFRLDKCFKPISIT